MYPYEFRQKNFGINHREIFVVMPFQECYDDIFDDLIEPATKQANNELNYSDDNALKPYRTKDDIKTTSGWINILEHLNSAKIVLGVLTSDNPNVFYELGIAHATQPITRQILIANSDYNPRFNTKDLIFYNYDETKLVTSIAPLAQRIVDRIKSYQIEQQKSISQARMTIGPFDFEVIMHHGNVSHFSVKSDDLVWRAIYEKQHGNGAFEKHIAGITNLCNNNFHKFFI